MLKHKYHILLFFWTLSIISSRKLNLKNPIYGSMNYAKERRLFMYASR